MRYFDGMGRDVTAYVEDLKKQIKRIPPKPVAVVPKKTKKVKVNTNP